jgi:tetratricopeptide (TPR) repeat protein
LIPIEGLETGVVRIARSITGKREGGLLFEPCPGPFGFGTRLLCVVLLIQACAIGAGCAAEGREPGPITSPTQRVEFDGFSILPPRAKGWVRLELPPQVDPNMAVRAYFIKRLSEGTTSPSDLHRLTAVVRTFRVGDVKIEKPLDLLESIARGFSGSTLGKCFGRDCVRYQSTSEEQKNPQFPGCVFEISKQGFIVLHPDSPTLVINLEYRQYYAREVQPLSGEALEREVEPFQNSLEFTALRSTAQVPTPAPWASQMEAGFRAAERQRWPEAEASFKAALDEAEKSFAPQDLRLAQALYHLALVEVSQHRYKDAEPLYRQALAIYEQHPGADQRFYGQTLSDLGTLYLVQGRYDQAEPLLQRSLAVREAAQGPDHRDVGQSLYNLMDLYARWDRWAEAEPFARRALPIYERAKGREARWLGSILHFLGQSYEKQGRLADAERLFNRGLTITETFLGTQDPEVAHQLEDYAALLRKMGRQQEAEELEARARAIREKASQSR